MTASAPSRWARRCGAGAGALAWLLAACAGPSAPPLGSPVQPLPRLAATVPDEADRAVRDLATGILVDDRQGVAASVERLGRLDAGHREEEGLATGLVPYALDARNALLGDARARSGATRALLERDDLGPELRSRLEAELHDDPLRLASERLQDARVRRVGRAVNAVVEPMGRSITSTALLPVRVVQGLLGAALAEHGDDELTAPERQALDHWKRFIEAHPDAPEAAELLGRVEEAQIRWLRTQRDHALRRARDALEAGDPAMAAAQAQRALRYRPEDADALDLLDQARIQGQRAARERRLSLAAAPDSPPAPAERELAVALLGAGPERIAAAAQALHEAAPEGPLADEADFALALAALERGEEGAMWERLEALAERDGKRSNMARHAAAITTSPELNPYRAFVAARSAVRSHKLRWLALGPLADGARDRDLPRWAEWMVEIPSSVGVVAGLGNRLIRYPFLEVEWSVPSVLARRYLERFPEGEHVPEMRTWLREFESDRGNHVGALKLLQADPEASPEELAKLREKAATQALEASRKERRRDVRYELLQEVAREFQGAEAAQEAGALAREELRNASPQRIRISRGFLRENPRVAGPEGLALRPVLLDGERRNGELHPDGVTLLGGRAVEFAFLAEDGRESSPPKRVRRRISEERLARVVAQLEEATLHLARVDADAEIEPDADRDLFFERARLGVLEPDPRPHAESTYSFLGMRERYGVVRGRESILPVEIVLQGSFADFGLGAFPRIRMPKPTPDAFLYR